MRYASLLAVTLLATSLASANDWLTLPSTYSHDPVTGARVDQYAPIEPPSVPMPANFRSSGYTNTRSSLRFGPSSDHYHRVEKWGDPVRPYGEWQFPYRPYSTPYPYWGPPFGGLDIVYGGNGPWSPGQWSRGAYRGRPSYGQDDHNRDHRGRPGHGDGHDHPRPPRDVTRGYLGDGPWPLDPPRQPRQPRQWRW